MRQGKGGGGVLPLLPHFSQLCLRWSVVGDFIRAVIRYKKERTFPPNHSTHHLPSPLTKALSLTPAMSATLIIALCLISSLHPTAAQDGSCNANDPSQKSCHLSNEFKWKWDPTSTSHPCTIHRISQSTLLKSFGHLGLPNLYAYPLVIYPDDFDEQPSRSNRNAAFANSTTLDNLPKQFSSDFTVTLTGSDSLSSHRRSIPLS